jgi:hypothetical protein
MKFILGIISTIALMIYSAILSGWGLSKLWLWFIVPTFNAPLLKIPEAIGVSMVVTYMISVPTKSKEESFLKAFVLAFVFCTFKPLIALLFGSIIRMWM